MATAINQNSLGEITGNVLFYSKPEPLAPASGQAASPELRLRLRLAFAA